MSLPITTRPRAGFLSYHTNSSTRGKENTRPKNQRHFSLGWQVLKTMLIRHETIFIPPGSTTSKPQTPSRCPGSSPFYTKTKLRENATNNPEQRCICSKHGFHPERVPAPRRLGWQILKTMLIRYDARDTLGAAGQISMVSIPGAY